jgi:hypothetical protein
MGIGGKERPQQQELDPELLKGFADTFLPTFDYFPQQTSDGSYRAVYSPFSLDVVEQHLRGSVTIGAYALNQENKAKWLCFDADSDEQWGELLRLQTKLETDSVPAYLEQSRRGGHLWLFFAEALSGRDVRRFGRHLLESVDSTIKEIYPRQDELTTGVGSLVRLPLGIHRKSGKRYGFVTPDGRPLAPTAREQMAILAHPHSISKPYVQIVLSSLPKEEPNPIPKDLRRLFAGNAKQLSERIKRSISVYEFVSRFVDLDEHGRGLCPFHDDHRQSFGVNQDGNFWSCFAQCGEKPHGGSIIHFWQKWRRDLYGFDGDFVPTITELAKILRL